MASFELVAEYPAAKVFKCPQKILDGMTLVKSDHLGTYAPGNVFSHALKSGDCPIEAMEESIGFGHKLYWISGKGACISNSTRTSKETWFEIDFDSVYKYCGKMWKIAPTHNNNLMWVPI